MKEFLQGQYIYRTGIGTAKTVPLKMKHETNFTILTNFAINIISTCNIFPIFKFWVREGRHYATST
jgi:hypothetical protein